jgi:hypothetical protein
LFPRSELDNPLDWFMKKARTSRGRTAAIALPLLAAIILPSDPDQLLGERRFPMTKIAAADETQNNAHDRTTPPARDPKIAVEEEYQMARRQGTAQALELFIARHPDDPLAETARADLRRLSR